MVRLRVSEVTVVEIALSCGKAADGHYTRGSRCAQQGQQVRGQREVTQMVGAELQFEAIVGFLALWWRYDGGVVDQDVDRAAFRRQLIAQRRHTFQR
jgi:hypothetical protein